MIGSSDVVNYNTMKHASLFLISFPRRSAVYPIPLRNNGLQHDAKWERRGPTGDLFQGKPSGAAERARCWGAPVCRWDRGIFRQNPFSLSDGVYKNDVPPP